MSEIPRGAIRFNTDSNKPELWDGSQWAEFQLSYVGLGTGGDTGPGARGLFGGGARPAIQGYADIEYINISSTGNAIDFGDLLYARRDLGACASSTRGVFAGGAPVSTPLGYGAKVDYVTISSTGTAIDFGASLTFGRRAVCGCGNQTRGLFAGGNNDASPLTIYNTIDYITIASTGDVVDFGDFGTADTSSGVSARGCLSSPTRAVFGGGETPTNLNNMDFVTISTLGDSQDFGDLSAANRHLDGCSNSVRGLFGGGTPTQTNTIDYITISSTGNATNFGDLIKSGNNRGTCSSPTRGVWAGGYVPSVDRTIEYVTINTEGNAVDFGDLTGSNSGDKAQLAGCSNAHGGL